MQKSIDHIILNYKNRIAKAETEIEVNKSLSNRYSLVRLGIFIFAIPLLYFIIKTDLIVFFSVFAVLLVLFLWAVVQQLNYDKLLKNAEAKKSINLNELNTLLHHQNLYFNGEEYSIHNHLYTEDLDIFGQHSLFGLINRSRTYYGNQILKSFFLAKPTQENIEQRQEAIEELSQNIDWRQKLAVSLFDLENLHHFNVADEIRENLSLDMSFSKKKFLALYRKSLPLIWILIFGLYLYDSSIANTIFAFIFIGNLVLVGKYTQQISLIQSKLSQTSTSLKKYLEALKIIFNTSWKSKLLIDKTKDFENSKSEMPIKSLAELNTLINKLDYRLNFLVAIVLNGFILWDIKIISDLSTWKENNNEKIALIFSHIGYMEAMCSLAAWSYNHPHYHYPQIHKDHLRIAAKDLEHPLIPDNQNVGNDFDLHPDDKISIITGSNMSGKSTFLRTLAINMILGYTGAKTCASSLSIPVVSIVTYMRIKDALEENVSTFKAELNRISMILKVLQKDKNAFIFIDEMLRGTNSKDKLNGSIGITKKLLEMNTYAIIATHDIKLAELGESDNRIANYFFDIDYENGDLVFDYKLKEGICENFNASFLLGQLGINTDLTS
ncbi:MAG: hypothetical protein P1U56_12315 [Saprospiraceae bacterium]|nr:hypothetical protein [Saprospiraceae bacterium]